MRLVFFSVAVVFIWLDLMTQVKGQSSAASTKQKQGLVIYDSLIMNGANVYLTDYNKSLGLYLGYDFNGTDILLFTGKGEIKNRFDRYGEGPEEYRYTNSMTVRFWGSNSIVVRVNNQLKLYTFEGRFKKTIKIDDGMPNSLRLKLFVYLDKENDTNVVYYSDMPSKFPSTLAGFYTDTSRKVIANYNIGSKTLKRYVGFERESIYLNGEMYYSDLIPRVYLNYEKRLLDVIYQNEQKIFSYDIDNGFKYLGFISIDADYFGNITGMPFGKRIDGFRFKQMNSKYINMISIADTILTMYNKGLGQDKVYSSMEERNENVDKIPKFLQVIVSGQKLCNDIRLPNSVLALKYVHGLRQIIFKKSPNEHDEMNNTTTFLIGKIVY